MAFLRNTIRAASHVRAVAAPQRPARMPRIQLARAFSTENEKPAGSGPPKNDIGRLVLATVVIAFGITTGVYVTKSKEPPNNPDNYFKSRYDFVPTIEDYQKVYNDIADGLESRPEYDAGSYAPILLRLSWHSSGTYSKEGPTGGSNGATMRFSVEAGHGANNGLGIARNYLEPIKEKYPWISYSDLWTIGGVCALQEMDGPKIEWRPGRKDKSEAATPPDGRLPDGAKGADHLRNIFYRLGYNDQEIVALSGAHGMGECHRDRSGFDGPWTFTPVSFTNQFFTLLLDETWKPRDWDGNFQYQDQSSKSLMMLPTDYCLIEDPNFKKYVELYAKDEDRFREDFKKVYTALIEKGVPEKFFEEGRKGLGGKKTIVFQTTAEQENDKRE